MKDPNNSPKQPSSAGIWLTLSKDKTDFEKQLFLADICVDLKEISVVKRTDKMKGDMARKLWSTLANVGIYLHPSLEKVYHAQGFCFWCGGQIMRVDGADKDTYEDRCLRCTYIYKEK